MPEPLRLQVTLETVTPLLLHGTEPGGEPELRPPSFRGMLRYWLRAALGGMLSGSNLLTDLHRLETAVFGSTDYGSPIGLRVLGTDPKKERVFILPHKPKGSHHAIASGQSFELLLTQNRTQKPEIWEAACAALELAVAFGGVGMRSRRGYGTLRIVQADSDQVAVSPRIRKGWYEHIERVTRRAINAATRLARSEKAQLVERLPEGPGMFPSANQTGIIRLGTLQYPSAMDGVVAFMEEVKAVPALGGIKPRQASPLWLRSVQMEGGYGLLFVVLASHLKNRGEDYEWVKQFLSKFDGQDIRVKGWNT
ncbi:MAG: type III-B CRISPR module RAMP protein Cmr1 [Ardenticatenaceae bacterium]|nr:type III-B CRISPR module RAMP protein Cmr1 [Ardenticatenaceae bacterium]